MGNGERRGLISAALNGHFAAVLSLIFDYSKAAP
jgi:hypothetical protein